MFKWLTRTLRPASNGSTPLTDVNSNNNAQLDLSATYKIQGDQHLTTNNFVEAEKFYRHAILAAPNKAEIYVNLGIALTEQSHHKEAEDALKHAIKLKPDLAHAYYNLGTLLANQNRLSEAILNLNKTTALLPEEAMAYRDLGLTLIKDGQIQAAQEVALKGININPNLIDFHLILGRFYEQKNQPEVALDHLQNALSIQPQNPEIVILQCKILLKLNQWEKAQKRYQNALTFNPDHVYLNFGMGWTCQYLTQYDKAIHFYNKSIQLQSNFIEAHNNLGGVYKELGKLDEAMSCYQTALKINPYSAEVNCNIGLALKACGNLEEASVYFKHAIQHNPNSADAYCNLGNILVEQNRWDQAVQLYNKTLEIDPNFTNAHYGLGALCASQQKSEQAIQHLQRVVDLDPNHYTGKTLLLHQLQHVCNWNNMNMYIDEIRLALRETPISEKSMFPPLAFLPLPGITAAEQKLCAERWVESEIRFLPSLKDKLNFQFHRKDNAKIKIAYISADFRQHPVAFLMAEVFELHDRNKFHVTAYAYDNDKSSSMRERLERSVDKFVDIHNKSIDEAARIINADNIDILIDLTGHTQNSRSAILALRPSPIQVNYLGYPGTMGAKFIDYMIADRFTVPEENRAYYTENIIWMPDCFQANDRQRPRPESPTRQDCGLPENVIVFCCFNQTVKITPDIFNVWCRLLINIPHSVLWISASNRLAEINLRQELMKHGLSDARLIMAPLKYREEHLARLACADIFLDTCPFNAGTTCSDALWMGLPVITLVGEPFASRMAGSLLTALDIPELITYNLDDYYSLAYRLANSPLELADVRKKILQNRDHTTLFDSKLFTKNLESAYSQMINSFIHKSAQQ